MELVTLEEAKAALRIDYNDEDATLQLFLEAASEAVVAYLKSGADVFLDSAGNVVPDEVPHRAKWATIFLVGEMDRNRDADPDKGFEFGYLPKPVISLLYPLRDPAIA